MSLIQWATIQDRKTDEDDNNRIQGIQGYIMWDDMIKMRKLCKIIIVKRHKKEHLSIHVTCFIIFDLLN